LNHSLWREEERVPIAPKTFDVLRFLVENAGNLVTTDDLLEAIWPETYVNPEILRKYILEIRKVLGERRDGPIFIETQAKRGYRFVAPVEEFHPAPLPTSTPAASGFVGRERCLSALDGFLQAALNGQRKVVFVTGEAWYW
jgi:DNA-binding winged helix-turn-helix (wHTH) protein